MSKKAYNLIVGITGGACAIASAVVAFFQPSYAAAIVGGIGIAETAVIEIASLFLEGK